MKPLWFPAEADAKPSVGALLSLRAHGLRTERKKSTLKMSSLPKIKKQKRKQFTIRFTGFNNHKNRRKKRKKTQAAGLRG